MRVCKARIDPVNNWAGPKLDTFNCDQEHKSFTTFYWLSKLREHIMKWGRQGFTCKLEFSFSHLLVKHPWASYLSFCINFYIFNLSYYCCHYCQYNIKDCVLLSLWWLIELRIVKCLVQCLTHSESQMLCYQIQFLI